jgi:hypothetical protein
MTIFPESSHDFSFYGLASVFDAGLSQDDLVGSLRAVISDYDNDRLADARRDQEAHDLGPHSGRCRCLGPLRMFEMIRRQEGSPMERGDRLRDFSVGDRRTTNPRRHDAEPSSDGRHGDGDGRHPRRQGHRLRHGASGICAMCCQARALYCSGASGNAASCASSTVSCWSCGDTFTVNLPNPAAGMQGRIVVTKND